MCHACLVGSLCAGLALGPFPCTSIRGLATIGTCIRVGHESQLRGRVVGTGKASFDQAAQKVSCTIGRIDTLPVFDCLSTGQCPAMPVAR